MNLKRLLHTNFGITLISILLGFGLATLFAKACNGEKCLQFNGPIIDEMSGKTFKFGEQCYKYNFESAPCDATKKVVDIKRVEDSVA